jgi:hypothetical protein
VDFSQFPSFPALFLLVLSTINSKLKEVIKFFLGFVYFVLSRVILRVFILCQEPVLASVAFKTSLAKFYKKIVIFFQREAMLLQ